MHRRLAATLPFRRVFIRRGYVVHHIIVALPAGNPFASLENGTYPKKLRRRNFDGRIDHHLNDSHNMYVRYAYDFYVDFAPIKPLRSLDGGALNLGSSDYDDYSRSHSIVAEENWICLEPRSTRSARTC